MPSSRSAAQVTTTSSTQTSRTSQGVPISYSAATETRELISSLQPAILKSSSMNAMKSRTLVLSSEEWLSLTSTATVTLKCGWPPTKKATSKLSKLHQILKNSSKSGAPDTLSSNERCIYLID